MSFIIDQSDSVRPRDSGIEPLVVRPRAACKMYGNCSIDELYRKIRDGEVTSYLDGRRRLITVESIKADIARGLAAAAANGFERARGARRPTNKNLTTA
jgi:hypothetical protein